MVQYHSESYKKAFDLSMHLENSEQKIEKYLKFLPMISKARIRRNLTFLMRNQFDFSKKWFENNLNLRHNG